MNSPASEALARSPVFNAVSAGLLMLSVAGFLLVISSPPGAQDMMVPWLRPVGMMQAMIGAACVVLIWFRQGWAFYLYVGLILFGVLLSLVLRQPWPYLLIGPGLLLLYLWGLHAGGATSMWRQMFGGAGLPGRGLAYGSAPAMPPSLPASAAPPPAMPPAVRPAPAAGLDPLAALKRLGALRDSGAISEQEFAAKKAELLKRI